MPHRMFPLIAFLSLLVTVKAFLYNGSIIIENESVLESRVLSLSSSLLLLEKTWPESYYFLNEYSLNGSGILKSSLPINLDYVTTFTVSPDENMVYFVGQNSTGQKNIFSLSRISRKISLILKVSSEVNLVADHENIYYCDYWIGVYSRNIKNGTVNWLRYINQNSMIKLKDNILWVVSDRFAIIMMSPQTGAIIKTLYCNEYVMDFDIFGMYLYIFTTSSRLKKVEITSGTIVNTVPYRLISDDSDLRITESHAYRTTGRGTLISYRLHDGEKEGEYVADGPKSLLHVSDQMIIMTARYGQRNNLTVLSISNISCPIGFGLNKSKNDCTRCESGFYKNTFEYSPCEPCPQGGLCVNGTFYGCRVNYTMSQFSTRICKPDRIIESGFSFEVVALIIGSILFPFFLALLARIFRRCRGDSSKVKVSSKEFLPKEVIIKTDDGLPHLKVWERIRVYKFLFENLVLQPATISLDLYTMLQIFTTPCFLSVVQLINSGLQTLIVAFSISAVSASVIWAIYFINLMRNEAKKVALFLKNKTTKSSYDQKVWILIERLDNLHYSTSYHFYHACLLLLIINDGFQYGNSFLVPLATTQSFPMTLFIRSAYATIGLGDITSYFFIRLMLFPAFLFECLPRQGKFTDYKLFKGISIFLRLSFTAGLLFMPISSYMLMRGDTQTLLYSRTVIAAPISNMTKFEEHLKWLDPEIISDLKSSPTGFQLHYLTVPRNLWLNSTVEILKVSNFTVGDSLTTDRVSFRSTPNNVTFFGQKYSRVTLSDTGFLKINDDPYVKSFYRINEDVSYKARRDDDSRSSDFLSPTDLPSKTCAVVGKSCKNPGIFKRHYCWGNEQVGQTYCIFTLVSAISIWEQICTFGN